MSKLSGKTVLVTGASRGIGAATALECAKQGANVVLLARSEDQIAKLAAEIGDAALAVPCDVSSFEAVSAAFDAARAAFGEPDVVINNAGVINPIASFAEADPADWARLIEINLIGMFNGMRAAIPAMRAAGAGTIINISSGAAVRPQEGWSAYCTSKAGCLMLTRAADLENRDAGLRIMGLSPGTVATDMQREIKASGINRFSELDWSDHIPADWPAKALVWAICDAPDEVLGTDISLRDDAIRRAAGLI